MTDDERVSELRKRLEVRKRKDFPRFPGVHDKWDIWDLERNDWLNEGISGPFWYRKHAEQACDKLAEYYGRMRLVCASS